MNAQFLFLDSDHASKVSEGPSDIIYNLNFNTGNNMEGYAISLQSVMLPNLVYPINKNNQNIYFKEDGGATISFALDENNYTGTQIATELQSKLNANTGLGRVYAVSYSTQTRKLTTTETGGLPNTIQYVDGSKNAYVELGINSSKGAATIYTHSYPVDLSGTEYVDLQTDITTSNYSSNGKTNILERVPMSVSFGEIMTYQNTTDDYIRLNEDSISSLEIRLLDDKGNLWDLPGNAQVAFVFKLAIVE